MHRQKLLKLLESYSPKDSQEKQIKQQIISFINENSECFNSIYPKGHITASAWIIDPQRQKVCLIHHNMLNKWFQPGGHSDNNNDTPLEALREAIEETNLTNLKLLNGSIFDIGIQIIPSDKKRGLGLHSHFDIMFLVIGDSEISPKISDESNEAKWIDINEVLNYNCEDDFQRIVNKTLDFFRVLNP